MSGFLLVGVCAATGIAWDPSTAADVRGSSAPVTGVPWSAGPDAGPGTPAPATPEPARSPT
ncbi:hypothetical protein ACFWR5_28145, partial [Streptomyces sp. NPDC058613]